MRIIFTLFLCFLFSFSLYGQTDPVPEIDVAEISLARDDGNGDFGEETAEFFPTDVPIHCSILLTAPKAVTVKMVVVAVRAENLKPEAKIVTVSFKTSGEDNRVYFTASPPKIWRVGKYRVDIFLDGKLAESREFGVNSKQ